MTALVVTAKSPIPGRVKTRLTPDYTLEEAAALAAALISDTLATARTIRATRHILFWDNGPVESTVAPPGAGGFEIIRQPEGTLDERLGAIFDAIDEPMILIGMDTPQFSAAHFLGLFPEWPSGTGAVFGPADDGGFWALGMSEPDGDLIRGVPMSRADTGACQLAALHAADLRVSMLSALTDVDDHASAHSVAKLAPRGAFATTLARLDEARTTAAA